MPGNFKVGQEEIERLAAEQVERLFARRCPDDGISTLAQCAGKRCELSGFVFDDQQRSE
jgi:hypothetical protein